MFQVQKRVMLIQQPIGKVFGWQSIAYTSNINRAKKLYKANKAERRVINMDNYALVCKPI